MPIHDIEENLPNQSDEIYIEKNTQVIQQEEAVEESEEVTHQEIEIQLYKPEPKDMILYNEIAYYINPVANQLITYHSEDYEVKHHDLDLDLGKSFSITAANFGLFIVSVYNVWLWENGDIMNIKELSASHINHSAVIHNNMLVIISGKNTRKVEGLNLSNLTWENLEVINKPREFSNAISMDDGLYLFGGYKSGKICKSVLRYNSKWEKIN